ncbi:MAG: TolC family protein [Bacteroidota bacterium]|nr:TolC family protein [Bacteroidota bacterium]
MKLKLATRLFTITIILFVFPAIIYSQQAWTLEECIDYALEHNISVKQQQLNTAMNKNNLLQSKHSLLPSINAGVSGSLNLGRSVDPLTYEFTTENVKSSNFAINSSVTLFSGLQQYNTIKANEYNLKASLQDYKKLKNDIALYISTAYLQVLFAEELVVIAEDQLEITRQQVSRTNKLVEAGSLAQGSLLEIQAQEAAEELQLVTAQNNLDISYLTLTQLLELETAENFKIVKPQIEEINESSILQSASSIYSEGVAVLPQIKSAELKLKSSEKNLAVSRGAYLPHLSLSGRINTGYSNNRYIPDKAKVPDIIEIGYTTSGEIVYAPFFQPIQADYPFSDQLKDNAYKSVSLNLTIPIFNNLQVYMGVKNSKLNVINNKYSLDQAKNTLYKDIQKAYTDAVAALKKYKVSEKSVEAIKESFRYTSQKFDVGLVTSFDYNQAKTQLTKVKSDLLQAKYEYIFKSNILQFYRGKPIRL